MNSSLAESKDKTKPLSSKPNHVADQSPILPKQQILEFHKLVLKISARLITVASEDLDAEILRALKESLEPLGVDRGGLLEDSETVAVIDKRHRQSFRYYRSGSPFEYDMMHMLYTFKREIEIAR